MKVKLKYNFNTSGELEVYMNSLKGWYRTTATDFRAFNGKRRITQPTAPQKRGEIFNVEMITEEYKGPVYVYGTNIVYEFTDENSGTIVTGDLYDKLHRISKKREL